LITLHFFFAGAAFIPDSISLGQIIAPFAVHGHSLAFFPGSLSSVRFSLGKAAGSLDIAGRSLNIAAGSLGF